MSNFWIHTFLWKDNSLNLENISDELDIPVWHGGDFPNLMQKGVCRISSPLQIRGLEEFSQREFGFVYDKSLTFGLIRAKSESDQLAYDVGRAKIYGFFGLALKQGVEKAFALWEFEIPILTVTGGELTLNPLCVREDETHLFPHPLAWRELPIF